MVLDDSCMRMNHARYREYQEKIQKISASNGGVSSSNCATLIQIALNAYLFSYSNIYAMERSIYPKEMILGFLKHNQRHGILGIYYYKCKYASNNKLDINHIFFKVVDTNHLQLKHPSRIIPDSASSVGGFGPYFATASKYSAITSSYGINPDTFPHPIRSALNEFKTSIFFEGLFKADNTIGGALHFNNSISDNDLLIYNDLADGCPRIIFKPHYSGSLFLKDKNFSVRTYRPGFSEKEILVDTSFPAGQWMRLNISTCPTWYTYITGLDPLVDNFILYGKSLLGLDLKWEPGSEITLVHDTSYLPDRSTVKSLNIDALENKISSMNINKTYSGNTAKDNPQIIIRGGEHFDNKEIQFTINCKNKTDASRWVLKCEDNQTFSGTSFNQQVKIKFSLPNPSIGKKYLLKLDLYSENNSLVNSLETPVHVSPSLWLSLTEPITAVQKSVNINLPFKIKFLISDLKLLFGKYRIEYCDDSNRKFPTIKIKLLNWKDPNDSLVEPKFLLSKESGQFQGDGQS